MIPKARYRMIKKCKSTQMKPQEVADLIRYMLQTGKTGDIRLHVDGILLVSDINAGKYTEDSHAG